MLYKNKKDFIACKDKKISLIGMSGIGKTHLALKLLNDDRHAWDHFSVDYHIAKSYLLDIIKKEVVNNFDNSEEWIQKMIQAGILKFELKVTAENINVLSLFLSKLGDSKGGGLSLAEFVRRQQLYREAEKQSIFDAIKYAQKQRPNSMNVILDTAGSICEIIDLVDDYKDSINFADRLANNYLIVYLRAEEKDVQQLIDRQTIATKPMLYSNKLLQTEIKAFMDEHKLNNVDEIQPDKFCLQIFIKTIKSRQNKYLKLTENRGIIISTNELTNINNSEDFFDVIADKL